MKESIATLTEEIAALTTQIDQATAAAAKLRGEVVRGAREVEPDV